MSIVNLIINYELQNTLNLRIMTLHVPSYRHNLGMSVRRNPSRRAHPSYCQGQSDHPMTRSMSRTGCAELSNGLRDDQEVKRFVYMTRLESVLVGGESRH